MAQCSQCKRAVSPETVVVSDDEGFVAVASDNQYVTSYFLFVGNLERFIVLSLELMKRRMLMILSILTREKQNLARTGSAAKSIPGLLTKMMLLSERNMP